MGQGGGKKKRRETFKRQAKKVSPDWDVGTENSQLVVCSRERG